MTALPRLVSRSSSDPIKQRPMRRLRTEARLRRNGQRLKGIDSIRPVTEARLIHAGAWLRAGSRTSWPTLFGPACWRSPVATRTPMISTGCVTISLQARLRAAARQRTGPVLAADPVASREPAGPQDRHPAFQCAGRSLAAKLPGGAHKCDARYRRHARCRARPSAAVAVQCSL